MAHPHPSTRPAQSRALAVTVALAALAFWRPAMDVFGYPKFAVMVLVAAVALAIAAHRTAMTGSLELPAGLPVWILGGFSGAILISLAASETPSLSLVGLASRHTGALFYLVGVISAILLLQLALHDGACRQESTRTLALGVLAGGALVAFYGVVQLVGLDPLEWVTQNERVGELRTSTFGNPNFTAAFLGAALPVAVWASWSGYNGIYLRVAGGTAAAATIAVLVDNGSIQGPMTAAAGLLGFIVAVILELPSARVRRLALSALALAASLLAAVAAAGLAGAGPLRSLGAQANVDLRTYYWGAGLRMFADQPVTGVGPDRYGAYFAAARSPEAAERLGLTFSVDAAHNVPIQLFATGGLLVGATYLAFVCVTAWGLVRGLRGSSGRSRLLLGAIGGVWLAYQAQSLVSIDTPPLALMHWLSAAAILSWSGLVSSRTVELPWASSRRPHQRRFRRRLSLGLLGVLLIGTVLLLRVPLAASTDAARGRAYADAQMPAEATQHLARAAERASWEPAYPQMLGQVALEQGDTELALQAYQEALDRDPRSITALVTAARIAEQQRDFTLASDLYERALEVEPQASALLSEAAEFHAEHGDPSLAAELAARADSPGG